MTEGLPERDSAPDPKQTKAKKGPAKSQKLIDTSPKLNIESIIEDGKRRVAAESAAAAPRPPAPLPVLTAVERREFSANARFVFQNYAFGAKFTSGFHVDDALESLEQWSDEELDRFVVRHRGSYAVQTDELARRMKLLKPHTKSSGMKS